MRDGAVQELERGVGLLAVLLSLKTSKREREAEHQGSIFSLSLVAVQCFINYLPKTEMEFIRFRQSFFFFLLSACV